MDNAIVLFLLRAIHVVGGVLWVGGVVVVSFFLLPATQALGPAAQPVMQFIMGRRKLSVYLMVLGILTTLAGVLLMMRNISLTNGVWARSPMGIGISVGAAAAILALVVGMSVSAPAAKRLGGPPKPGATPLTDDQRAALMRRIAFGSRATFVLLSIAALFMATARYF
ncbi:MAG: hypothetical protein ACJ79A_13060 [Gemmatimonadaceae bacterium]